MLNNFWAYPVPSPITKPYRTAVKLGPFPPSDLTQRLTLSVSLKRPLMKVIFYLGLTWNTFALLSNLSPSFLVLAPNLLRGTWH